MTISAELPDAVLHTDPFYLETILVNVIKNGIEANAHGGGKVTIDPVDGGIQIADEGEGIPESVASRIGKPGYTTRQNGSGMGVFIVKELCRILGFSFRMDSSPGSGTRVYVGYSHAEAQHRDP